MNVLRMLIIGEVTSQGLQVHITFGNQYRDHGAYIYVTLI
jgi:hypothetical protein